MMAIIQNDVQLLLDLGVLSEKNHKMWKFSVKEVGLTPLMVACCIGK
jgi:hypothetical protein